MEQDAERMCNVLGIRSKGIIWQEYLRRHKMTLATVIPTLRKLVKREQQLMLTPDGFYYIE